MTFRTKGATSVMVDKLIQKGWYTGTGRRKTAGNACCG